MFHVKTCIFTGLAVLLVSTLAVAAPMKGKQGNATNSGPQMSQWYDQLSEEQQEALQDIHDKYYDQLNDLRLQLRAKKAALNVQILGSEPDQGKVDTLVEEINELRGEFYSTKVQMQMEKRENDLPVRGMGMRGKGMMQGQGMMQGKSCPMMHKKMQGGQMMKGKGMMRGGQGMGQGMMQGQNAPQSAN
ncbi:MAG: periplasmic heavy metal sensor [Desulfovermiculus sp.]